MTVHLMVDDGVDRDRILVLPKEAVHARFGIHHMTIHVERAVPGGDNYSGC